MRSDPGRPGEVTDRCEYQTSKHFVKLTDFTTLENYHSSTYSRFCCSGHEGNRRNNLFRLQSTYQDLQVPGLPSQHLAWLNAGGLNAASGQLDRCISTKKQCLIHLLQNLNLLQPTVYVLSHRCAQRDRGREDSSLVPVITYKEFSTQMG